MLEVAKFDIYREYSTEATIRQAVNLVKKLISSVHTRGRHAVSRRRNVVLSSLALQ